MPASLRPMGQLKELLNNQTEVTVQAGKTVREALVALQIKPEIVAGVIVNGALESKDYMLQDGDQVKLMAVMSGG